MNNNNGMTQVNKPKFSVAITTEKYQNLIANTIKDPARARRFITAISSSVAVNPQLQECDAGSILSGALLGEALNLSPSPQLGQYYLVPFKNRKTGESKAQYVLGYKGYIQLAIRSGYYKKINVLEIKQGELRYFDPLNEEISVNLIEDYAEREAAPTIGYYAMFEYLNGFRKAMYWSKEKMEIHANTYSPAFNLSSYRKLKNGEIKESDMWKYSSFWYKDFDMMAKKTMLRQIISHWGIMSIEMQQAFEQDGAVADVDNKGHLLVTPEDKAEALNAHEISVDDSIEADAVEQGAIEQVDMNEL